MSEISEQLELPMFPQIVYCHETSTSGTFTISHWAIAWPTRDDILRHNVKRIWAGFSLVAMFVVPWLLLKLIGAA